MSTEEFKPIKQRKDQSNEDFIKEAWAKKEETQEEYILIFTDGADLFTNDYNSIEELTSAYQSQKNLPKEKIIDMDTVLPNEENNSMVTSEATEKNEETSHTSAIMENRFLFRQGKNQSAEDFIEEVWKRKEETHKDYMMYFLDGETLTTNEFDSKEALLNEYQELSNLTEKVTVDMDTVLPSEGNNSMVISEGEEKSGDISNTSIPVHEEPTIEAANLPEEPRTLQEKEETDAIIMQNEGEDEFEFIQRAVQETRESNLPKILKFLDGVTISTTDYDLDDKIVANIMFAEYNKKLGEVLAETESKLESFVDTINQFELNSQITDPLQFLLDASNQKYNSEEQKSKTLQLKKQKEDLKQQQDELYNRLTVEMSKDVAIADQQKKILATELKNRKEALELTIKSNEHVVEELKKDLQEQTAKMAEEQENLQTIIEKIEALKATPNAKFEESYYKEKETCQGWINAYEEYIDFVNKELAEHEENIKRARTGIAEAAKDAKGKQEIINNNLNSKYGSVVYKDGKLCLSLDKVPEWKKLTEKRLEIESQLAKLERNPQEIHDNIKKMMLNRESEELVAQEIDLLISTIANPQIKGVLKGDESKAQSTNEQIENLENELGRVKDRYNNPDSYFNQKEKIADTQEKNDLETEIQEFERDIQSLEEQLRIHEKQKKLPKLKKRLKIVQRQIKEQEQELEYSLSDDERLDIETDIDNLKHQEARLNERINSITKYGKIPNHWQIQRQISSLRYAIDQNRSRIIELEEKSSEDYFNYEEQTRDKESIDKLEQELEELRNQQKYLGEHNVEDLKNQILESYNKALNGRANENNSEEVSDEELNNISESEEVDDEELLEYEEAKPSLLQKIKSSITKSKVKKAFTACVMMLLIAVGGKAYFGNSDAKTEEVATNISSELEDTDASIDGTIGEKVSQEVEKIAKEQVQEVEKQKQSEEKVETPVEEESSDLEKMAEDALQDVLDGTSNVVYDNAYDAARNENSKYILSEGAQDAWANAEPGKFYAMNQEGKMIQVSLDEATDYMEQGYQVVSTFENEGGTIGYLTLENSAESMTNNGGSYGK